MGKFKCSILEIFVLTIFWFPLATLLQGIFPFLNKILFAFTTFILLCNAYTVQKTKPKMIYLLIFGLMLWGIALFNTKLEALRVNYNMAIYFVFFVIYIMVIRQNVQRYWEILGRHKQYLLLVSAVYSFLVFVSIFWRGSYRTMANEGWGMTRYFMSFSESPNRVGPASLFVVVILIYLVQQNCQKILCAMLAIPQLYVFVMGGSRTYAILGLSSLIILLYYLVGDAKKFYIYLLPVLLLLLLAVVNSNLMYKIEVTFQRGAINRVVFWQKLTNTRSIFWVAQMKMFFKTSFLHQLFGNGINFTSYYYGLWAHNDFIEILCSYGYVGLIYYLVLILSTIRYFFEDSQAPWLIKALCFFIWFFNAFCNFFYCYFCAMLSYPLLLIVLKNTREVKADASRILRIRFHGGN